MSVELVILNDSSARAAGYLEQSSGRMLAELATEMRKQMLELKGVVQEDYLSGQMVNRRTGTLSRGLHDDVEATDAQITGTLGVGPEVPYAKFVHDGTAPHVIEAANGRALCFMVNGQKVFARRVNHPGTAPRPFLTDALNAQREKIVAGLTEALARGAKA